MFEQLVFYAFSALVIFAATMVITVRNPVHAALFLVLAFFASSGLWLLLEAEFLAIALVLVYVGAVMVLFLFVVMMLDINIAVLREGFARYVPIGTVVAALMALSIGYVVSRDRFGMDAFSGVLRKDADYNNTEELGLVLFQDYLLPFEMASVILLVAIIAAIALTLRQTRQTKAPQPSEQVQVTRDERIRIVKMEAEE